MVSGRLKGAAARPHLLLILTVQAVLVQLLMGFTISLQKNGSIAPPSLQLPRRKSVRLGAAD